MSPFTLWCLKTTITSFLFLLAFLGWAIGRRIAGVPDSPTNLKWLGVSIYSTGFGTILTALSWVWIG
jgi:hypothetical protein